MTCDAAMSDAVFVNKTNQHQITKAMTDRYAHEAAPFIPGARILVVDDNDILRGVIEEILSRAGYDTDSVGDGEEALAMLATDDFDLVLTDGEMPRLNGCGLIRALRGGGSRIPVTLISGSLAGGGELPADVRAEIAVALPKPATPRDLLAGVAHALRLRATAPGRTLIADANTATARPFQTNIPRTT